MNSIQNGVANFWIGEFASTSTLWKLPELIQMRRTQSSGTSDAGPMWLPASSSSTTPSVAGMCSGAYHGVHNLAEKYGV